MDKFVKVNDVPLYLQLKNYLKSSIEYGELKPGDQIPSESELQDLYSLSRVTIRNAISELVKEGYIVKIQGKGTFVSQAVNSEKSNSIKSFSKLCRMQGGVPSSDVLFADMVNGNDEDCDFFSLPHHSRLMCIVRLRKVNDVPVVLETNYFPPEYEFLKKEDLSESLYDLLINKFHVMPTSKGLNRVGILEVDPRNAGLLKIPEGTPTIHNVVHVYDLKGDPLHTVVEIVRVDLPNIFKYYL